MYKNWLNSVYLPFQCMPWEMKFSMIAKLVSHCRDQNLELVTEVAVAMGHGQDMMHDANVSKLYVYYITPKISHVSHQKKKFHHVA